MALDQLSLTPTATAAVDADYSDHATAVSVRNNPSDATADEAAKVPRLPRWTRQEILVLIQGKRVAENRVRRGRTAGLAFGSGQVEPKWASVSSYCKRHGVNRGPVQCRKRWSNLSGDYKKIKEWEAQMKEEADSFWVMRNDLRRERKLPGFFDREVYDILDGTATHDTGEDLALALPPTLAITMGPGQADGGGGEEADADTVDAIFDSGRSAADDGLFSDFEQSVQDDIGLIKETPVTAIPASTPISGKQQYQPFSHAHPAQGTSYEKQPEFGSTTKEGRKRKRHAQEEGSRDEEGYEAKGIHDQLIEAMERNGRLLSSHLESQNMNLHLEREQRKEHVNSLTSVLDKLADALGRIADKL